MHKPVHGGYPGTPQRKAACRHLRDESGLCLKCEQYDALQQIAALQHAFDALLEGVTRPNLDSEHAHRMACLSGNWVQRLQATEGSRSREGTAARGAVAAMNNVLAVLAYAHKARAFAVLDSTLCLLSLRTVDALREDAAQQIRHARQIVAQWEETLR